jgi:hypothetical protein
MTEDKWALVHAYRRLAEDGHVSPIMCPRRDAAMVTLIDTAVDIDNPVYWCPACDTYMRPGVDLWDQIEAAVNDHQ